MENETELQYAILFGGGAIRGVAYCGAIEALSEMNIKYNILAGSSVGSIFAGLLAAGYNPKEIKAIIQTVNFELFKDIQFALGSQFALSKGEVFLDWIRDAIEKKFYEGSYKKGTHKAVTFADLEKDLVIITTDLSNFECKEFSKTETPDFEVASAIRISCSMPGLMKPVEYNNRTLVDGDLQKSVPMWKLSKNLQPDLDRILELRLEGDFVGNDKNIIDYLNSIYSFATCSGTSFLTELYGKRDKYDYIVINTGDLNIVDFNISDKKKEFLAQIGYSQTKEYFTKCLKEKKVTLREYYNTLLKHLDEIDRAITSNKFSNAKQELGNLYMALCDFKEYINERDLSMLNEFRNTFNQNLSTTFLGKVKVKNTNLVLAILKQCRHGISCKIKEYNSYLAE